MFLRSAMILQADSQDESLVKNIKSGSPVCLAGEQLVVVNENASSSLVVVIGPIFSLVSAIVGLFVLIIVLKFVGNE